MKSNQWLSQKRETIKRLENEIQEKRKKNEDLNDLVCEYQCNKDEYEYELQALHNAYNYEVQLSTIDFFENSNEDYEMFQYYLK